MIEIWLKKNERRMELTRLGQIDTMEYRQLTREVFEMYPDLKPPMYPNQLRQQEATLRCLSS